MDVFTEKKRSEIMSKNSSKNTTIEKMVFRELKKERIYFQKHYSKIFGNPDIVLPRKKKAVFIDGDFWHGYNFNNLKQKLPKGFWLEKIRNNISRDREVKTILVNEGWRILRIWEHEIRKDLKKTVIRIISFLQE